MKNYRDYIAELQKVLKSNNSQQLEDLLNDFYYDFYEDIETEKEDKYYDLQSEIINLLYEEILKRSELDLNIWGHFESITEDLISHIVFPFWYQLVQRINKNALKEKSEGDPGQTKLNFLQSEMNYLAECIYFRYTDTEKSRKIMNKEMILFLEARMNDLTELIMMGRMDKNINEIISMENADNDIELLGKFRGNSLQKRNAENVKKYPTVAKIIKVANELFPQLKITQVIACEIAGCNSFSFARWKTYKTNFNLYLKWQEEINEEEINGIKEKLRSYYKLHTDM